MTVPTAAAPPITTTSMSPTHDLVNGLPGDLLAAFGAMGRSHPGPQKAQIVINFRHRSHRGPGIFRCGLLVDGNGRRQAVDAVHIRLIHLSQKLPGVARQALHVTALTLGIDGVEGQAALAGTGKAGKNHQFIPGNGEIHIF